MKPSSAMIAAAWLGRFGTGSRQRGAVRATSRVEWTIGFNYRPVPRVVVKSEYQWLRNKARSGVNEWNLGLGFDF